ncbi:MAG: putative quinol monooxygenase [Cyclobacteriaceae bacterium]
MTLKKKMARRAGSIHLMLVALYFYGCAPAEEERPIVQMAKLQIDADQLEDYKAALKEEIAASVRKEPGVLTLYAVAEKDNPAHITVFEIYANVEAYQSHLESPHFKKYKSTTKEMVQSLELIETVPIALEAK